MSRALGREGEDAACRFLEEKGWVILDRNVTFRGGEVDIVARQGETVAFVEVKRRSDTRRGRPAEAVDAGKQRRIARVALRYAQEKGLLDTYLRFDVIEVLPEGIRHLEAAFLPQFE